MTATGRVCVVAGEGRDRPGVARLLTGIAGLLLLAACSTPRPAADAPARSPTVGASRAGGYYQDDGPGDAAPSDPSAIPDPQPRREPLLARANRPYVVFGRQYVPRTDLGPYRERGVASWYGRKFHGQKTSSGEVYDMYAMTAAHPTLPIPSYVRVTRVATGRSVVVRVNDRGPFLNNRVIDLSWTAAAKLGYVTAGSTEVEIEALTPDSPVEMPTAVASATSGGPAAGSSASAPGGGPAGGSSAAAAATAGAVASAGTAAGAQSGSGLGGGAPAASSGAVPPLVPPAAPDTVATIPVESRLIVETIALSADKNPGTAAAPPGAAAGTIYLQLGAFGSRDNAEAARGRMDRQFDWLSGRTDVRAEGSRFLVRAGPYATRELARTDAERIAQATGVRPFAITR